MITFTGLGGLPVDTFLISVQFGTPHKVCRIVRPSRMKAEAFGDRVTPDGRMLYQFWRGGCAAKSISKLGSLWHLAVLPGAEGYRELEGFKVLCDTKRAWASGPVEVSSALLARAIGWKPAWLT